jgi:hypothetical protein
MTPTELQGWRANMGYTRPVAADKLGVALVTFDKYIYGVYPIPEPIAKLCAALENLDN